MKYSELIALKSWGEVVKSCTKVYLNCKVNMERKVKTILLKLQETLAKLNKLIKLLKHF